MNCFVSVPFSFTVHVFSLDRSKLVIGIVAVPFSVHSSFVVIGPQYIFSISVPFCCPTVPFSRWTVINCYRVCSVFRPQSVCSLCLVCTILLSFRSVFGMLSPSPNHGTLRLPSDDEYDDFSVHCSCILVGPY